MAGRPSKLTPELIEHAKTYIATCVEYYDDMGKLQIELPSIEGLALFIGVARQNIYRWKDDAIDEDPALLDAFRDILEEVLARQAKRLLNQGLAGNYNSTIAKLILGKHGYVDEKHNEITSGGKPITPPPSILGDQIK